MREMLRFGWMRGREDLGVGNETIFFPSDGGKKPVAGFQRGSRVRSECGFKELSALRRQSSWGRLGPGGKAWERWQCRRADLEPWEGR